MNLRRRFWQPTLNAAPASIELRKMLPWMGVFWAASIIGCANSDSGQPNVPESVHVESPVPAEHQAGAEIYESQCALCHDEGDAGAPRLGSKSWETRLEKGLDVLTQHAADGFEGKWGVMPPQSDDLEIEEIKQAVDYMAYRYQSDQ